jgi:hypothetical protein
MRQVEKRRAWDVEWCWECLREGSRVAPILIRRRRGCGEIAAYYRALMARGWGGLIEVVSRICEDGRRGEVGENSGLRGSFWRAEGSVVLRLETAECCRLEVEEAVVVGG